MNCSADLAWNAAPGETQRRLWAMYQADVRLAGFADIKSLQIQTPQVARYQSGIP